MILRLAIICLISAAFGFGFSELVDHADLNPANPTNPCLDWSNPACAPPETQ